VFNSVLKKVLGTKHQREVKRMQPTVAAISALEGEIQKLSDAQLRGKTAEFRQQVDNGAPLDDLMIPAYAVAREAAKRVLGMRHYDVQLVGGIVLHQGKIAEMKTGEGKTLVATLPCYLNGLEGKGVHVVTVNDYLASRDAEWMGKLYGFLGLSTGVVVPGQSNQVKKRAYACDITYGQNNEFGFDYMRDNMKFSIYDYVQRDLNYAIVDEVDSILIDEARTPLIISGPGETASEKYEMINEIIPRLRKDEHYDLDEKSRSVTLTEDGMERSQELLGGRGLLGGDGNLYDPANLEALHILQQCLRAHALYHRDQHYMVSEDGKVMIIDEFTGRVLPGRRWSDGLHQAVEAKERVLIQSENLTLATISFQNLFRLYKKLSGMTGTADTEATEFHNIYELDVVVIPTNKPIARLDEEDLIYKTEREKFRALCLEIESSHKRGQPVLVGTTSVEKSDAVAHFLNRQGVPHNVLNAKQHEREAYVVAQAGTPGAVTVATNMAGRGTDIVLGGNPEMLGRIEVLEHGSEEVLSNPELREAAITEATERLVSKCKEDAERVKAAGGLQIIGTERHESRRIDNQLRGRSGRQGDAGSSRFFLSLEDDLMRIFAGERVQSMMDRLGMERASLGDTRRRERTEEGRGAQLRRSKAPARVRRRDESAAQEHVRVAQAGPARRVPHGTDRRRAEGRRGAGAAGRRRRRGPALARDEGAREHGEVPFVSVAGCGPHPGRCACTPQEVDRGGLVVADRPAGPAARKRHLRLVRLRRPARRVPPRPPRRLQTLGASGWHVADRAEGAPARFGRRNRHHDDRPRVPAWQALRRLGPRGARARL
jgi:preprotein translocase subunit SecA